MRGVVALNFAYKSGRNRFEANLNPVFFHVFQRFGGGIFESRCLFLRPPRTEEIRLGSEVPTRFPTGQLKKYFARFDSCISNRVLFDNSSRNCYNEINTIWRKIMVSVTFLVNGSEVVIHATEGDNLLETARRANVAIDAPCSGNGA